jgi:alpha-mannosidase
MTLATQPTKRQLVIDEIVKNIRKGILEPGERLLTVREMSARFNVSLSVIQNAMRELTNNGFVECRGASGFYVCENSSTAAREKNTPKPTAGPDGRIYLSVQHHSDMMWRYTYEKYEKIREEQLDHLLALSGRYPRLVFCFEQAEIARRYLAARPEMAGKVKELVAQRRLELFGGVCIPDLNMINGESIVRNLLLGRRYYAETFGKEPVISCMSDAFGMCAQLPQILVKSGFRYLRPGRMPNRSEGISGHEPFLWRGADDTVIPVMPPSAEITHLGHEVCLPVIYSHTNQLARNVAMLKYFEGDIQAVYLTEEGLVEEDLFWIIESVNREKGRKIEFGRAEDYCDAVMKNELPTHYGEFNPVFTGCYTTRISVKQAVRRAEESLFKAEFLHALAGTGGRNFDPEWHELCLAQFHDAICGCHHDAPNVQMMRKLDGILRATQAELPRFTGKGFSVCTFNNIAGPQWVESSEAPEGVEAQSDGDRIHFIAGLPRCGVGNFRKGKAKPSAGIPCGPVFSTDCFKVDFSQADPVISNLQGKNVFPASGFGELLIRHDFGSMWREKHSGHPRGREYQTEKVVESLEGPVFFKVVTEGEVLPGAIKCGNHGNHWAGFGSLRFRKEYFFPKHLDYFTMKVKLDWQGNNTKVLIRFPLNIKVSEAIGTYETPFGATVRKPYFEVPSEYASTVQSLSANADYEKACGDWPALNWVNYSDMKYGLTVANTGTPGHQLNAGSITVSLIRSGTEVADGGMTPQEGAFDNGAHEFEFAFRPHPPSRMGKACELGQILNRKPVVIPGLAPEGEFLNWDADNIALSAVCGVPGGILIRLYETLGRETETALGGRLVDGGLREAALDGTGGDEISAAGLKFKPFEIRTFLATTQPR